MITLEKTNSLVLGKKIIVEEPETEDIRKSLDKFGLEIIEKKSKTTKCCVCGVYIWNECSPGHTLMREAFRVTDMRFYLEPFDYLKEPNKLITCHWNCGGILKQQLIAGNFPK